MMIDVAKDIMRHLHLFSAGCYKSSYTLLRLQQKLSDNIVSYNFCEAQTGKGPFDRRASHIKSLIRRFINEGHVTTAIEIEQALDREKKQNINVKVVTSVNILDVPSRKSNIPGISQMYNFHYTGSVLKMWKAFSIGEGKRLKWNDLGSPSKTTDIKTIADWIGDIERTHEEDMVEENHNNQNEATNLECPNDSCIKKCSCQRAVDQHILMGNFV